MAVRESKDQNHLERESQGLDPLTGRDQGLVVQDMAVKESQDQNQLLSGESQGLDPLRG